jgi:hypothetical protein
MPSPQSANEMKAVIAAAARSDGSRRIVQQHQRCAGFVGGEGVEGQAGRDGDLYGMGHGGDFRCAPGFRSAIGAGGGTRTHTTLPSSDFKSYRV